MRRPLVIAAAAVLSGILCGLAGIPAVWKGTAAVIPIAAVIIFMQKSRGRNRPLFFIVTVTVLSFLAAFLRASRVSAFYGKEEFGSFYQKYEATNPGEFDYANYLKSMGVTTEEERKALKTRNRETEPPVVRILGDFREYSSGILDRSLTEHDAGILKAMLLGNKSAMEEDVKELYQESGIAHLLAVSGLHVSLIGTGLFDLLRKRLKTGLLAAVLLSLLTVVFYVIFTGASASSIRAGVMFLLSMAAKAAGRRTDLTTSLCLAGAGLLLWRPYLITQSGFLLSFTAIGGIILSAYVLKKQQRETKENESTGRADAPRRAVSALLSCLCVTLSTLPVIACSYFRAPLYSVLLNMAVIPLMSVVFLSGLAVLAFGLIGALLKSLPGVSGFFLWLSSAAAAPGHFILLLYGKLAELSMKLPGAQILLGRPENGKILLYYGILAVTVWIGSRLKSTGRAVLLLLAFYAAAFPFLKVREGTAPYVTVLDVGQGDSFHVHAGDTDILIDCGSGGYERAGSQIAENYFLSKGIGEIDVMIVSHADADHTNGILYLLSDSSPLKTGMLLLPALAEQDEKYDALREAAGDCPVRYCRQGTVLRDEMLECSCVYAETDTDALADTNRESSVWLLKSGSFRMLFTGDISEQEEQAICRQLREQGRLPDGGKGWDGRADVLKCAHHGSDTANSEEFLDMVRPDTAVLSYGAGNRYGHPSASVTERLTSRKIRSVSTAENGSITFRIDASGCRTETWKGGSS